MKRSDKESWCIEDAFVIDTMELYNSFGYETIAIVYKL